MTKKKQPPRGAATLGRELSQLAFCRRVLGPAEDSLLTPSARLRFLGLFDAALTDFFRVRFGRLFEKGGAARGKARLAGLLLRRVRALYALRDRLYAALPPAARTFGGAGGFPASEKADPAVFPDVEAAALRPGELRRLESGRVYLIVGSCGGRGRRLLLTLRPGAAPGAPADELLLRAAVERYAAPGDTCVAFRLTRSADLPRRLLRFTGPRAPAVLRALLRLREGLPPVRLEIRCPEDAPPDSPAVRRLLRETGIPAAQCFHLVSPLDLRPVPAASAMKPGLPGAGQGLLARALRGDRLLCTPYDGFEELVALLNEAAEAPAVCSIRIALYRLAADSAVAEALCRAARAGKRVTAVVELRARFDEENNLRWAARLRGAGCRVVYGPARLKVHAKLLQIALCTPEGGALITQVGTGNYHEGTASQYADCSLITADPAVGRDAARLFKTLTKGRPPRGKGSPGGLLLSPGALRPALLRLIAGERRLGAQGYILLKMNALTDRRLIGALVRAARAGVRVDCVVRGACCLDPGVPGAGGRIRVRSIVGRYLEHARIYCFGAGARMRMFLSSADWMKRSMERRIEAAAPVRDPLLRARLLGMLRLQLRDNVRARVLLPGGRYTAPPAGGPRLDSQAALHSLAQDRRCGGSGGAASA